MINSTRNQAERVAVFADVSNLYFGAIEQYGTKMSYSKFMQFTLAGRSLIRAVAYIVEGDRNSCDNFKKAVAEAGFDIRSKPVIRRADGSKKGNWDIAIAVDALAIGPRVDTVVIGSGDGDFQYLSHALRALGCRVEVAGFQRTTAIDLIESANEYKPIPCDLCQMMHKVRQPQDRMNNETSNHPPVAASPFDLALGETEERPCSNGSRRP